MALVDEVKKKPGMYSAANAELANAASQTAANYQNPVAAATRAALPNMPQGQMPGMFDVGTSGQRSLAGQYIVDPIRGFFERSAAQARGEAIPTAPAPARALTAGIVPTANAAAPNATQQPAVSDAYADEGQRGAAKTALSALANSSVAGGQNFADWQQGASQMQRDTAADAYRDAWQARAPQGMRGADANALALYNAEQTTRGTGVTAQRGKNGVMEFSGDGANALPQSFTKGVDLQLANERMARANAIREQYLNENQGTKGLGLRNPVEDTNAQFRVSRNMEMLQRVGPQQAQALARLMESQDNNKARADSLASSDRNAEANRELDAQRIAQTGDYNRGRLGIDQQEAGTRALTAGLQGEMTRSQLAEQQRIGKLRDAYMAETDPSKKEQMGRALLTLQGKEPSQPRDEETKARYGLISELAKSYGTMPPMGPDGKPVPFEQYAEPALRMAGGNRGGQPSQFPEAAVQALRANPKLAADFDAKYGQGASRQFIQ